MTGGAMGICTGNTVPGTMPGGFGRGSGMGMGRGRGGGWGWRNGGGGFPWAGAAPRGAVAFAPPTAEQELASLKQQAAAFGSALEEIQSQIQKREASSAPTDT
jgi:uncharacterized protein DUF5320